MIEAYLKHEAERKAQGIPPKPLDPEQTRELVRLLGAPPSRIGAMSFCEPRS